MQVSFTNNPLSVVGWAVWVGRTIATWAGAAVIAFLVSDFVVDKRAEGLDTAIDGLNTAIGSVENSLSNGFENMNVTMNGIQGSLTNIDNKLASNGDRFIGLTATTERNSERIVQLQADIRETQSQIARTGTALRSAFEEQSAVMWNSRSFSDALENVVLVPSDDGEAYKFIESGNINQFINEYRKDFAPGEEKNQE